MILELGALRYTTENPDRIEQLKDFGAVEVESSDQELYKMTVQELKGLAEKKQIEGYQEMKKSELIAALAGE